MVDNNIVVDGVLLVIDDGSVRGEVGPSPAFASTSVLWDMPCPL